MRNASAKSASRVSWLINTRGEVVSVRLRESCPCVGCLDGFFLRCGHIEEVGEKTRNESNMSYRRLTASQGQAFGVGSLKPMQAF